MVYPRTRLMSGKRVGKKAQVTLEITLGFIGALLLLLGALKVFVWVNERLVLRQEDYEGSVEGRKQFGRVEAGKADTEVQVDEQDTTRYKKFTIFE